MFDISNIIVEDFKSFKGRHTFAFPTEPGLYYATGHNLLNPRLGANGVGKSTFLIDAAFWCFYGRTARGLRASDVIEWYNGKKCSVEVAAIIGDDTLNVVRTQNPNSLKLNGETVDQETLVKKLRLNAEAFASSIVMPQFGEHFFDLKPAAKLTLFSDIMDLDFWLEKSKTAASRTIALEKVINSLNQNLSSNEGTVKALKAQRRQVRKANKEFEADRSKSLSEYELKLKGIEKAIKKIDPVLNDLKKSKSRLRKKYDSAYQKLNSSSKLFSETQDAISELRSEMRESTKVKGYIEEELNRFKRLEGKQCPTCKQTVDSKHFEDHKKIFKDKIANIQNELKSLEESFEEAKAVESEARALLRKREQLTTDYQDKYNVASTQLTNTEHSLKLLHHDRDNILENIKSIKKRKNPNTNMLKDLTKQITNLEIEIDELNEELRIALGKHEATSYWINGFKRIRLFIIEEAIKGLEIEVNNHLTSLGLLDWEIRFDVERENKSGGITKGFSVMVHPPNKEKPVRWEAFSGGEIQRLRLAGDLGLANLILERVGLVSAFEVHDEPSEHLSPEGLADVVETLHDRAHSLERKIWLVEQHSVDFGGFSGVLTVTKDKEGSHLNYEES